MVVDSIWVLSTYTTIEKVVVGLRDNYKVDFITPGHRTGEPTFTALRKAFGDRYPYAGLGITLTSAQTRALHRIKAWHH